MTNKEIIEKLTTYFTKQDSLLTARLCSNLIIDLNRFFHIEHLSKEEKDNLLERTNYNMTHILKFTADNTSTELKLYDMPVKENNE